MTTPAPESEGLRIAATASQEPAQSLPQGTTGKDWELQALKEADAKVCAEMGIGSDGIDRGATDTPDTDAAIHRHGDFPSGVILPDFARTLERRLAAAKLAEFMPGCGEWRWIDEANSANSALAALQRENEGLREEVAQWHIEKLRTDLATKGAQIAELREERDQAKRDWRHLYCVHDLLIRERDDARAALSALKEHDEMHREEFSILAKAHEEQIQYTGTVCDKLSAATARAETAEAEVKGITAERNWSVKQALAERDSALALVETCRKALEEDGLAWLEAKLAEAEASLRAREQMAQTLKSGTDASWEAAAKMHPTTANQPPFTMTERLKASAAQTRISAKCRRDVTMLRRIIEALAALPVATNLGHAAAGAGSVQESHDVSASSQPEEPSAPEGA